MSLYAIPAALALSLMSQAPDEAVVPAPVEHPADAYKEIGKDAPLTPSEVIRALHDAASNKDEAVFRTHLSTTFHDGVTQLQQETFTDKNPYAWSVFMAALGAEPLAKVSHNQFYERASVYAETSSGRAIKFRLALEGGHWRVVMPSPLEAELHRRQEAKEAAAAQQQVVPLTAASTQPASMPASLPSTDVAAAPGEAPLVLPPLPAEEADDDGFFSPGSITHYTLYAPDYLFIAGATTAVALRVYDRIPPLFQLIGPTHDPDSPDVGGLYDPRLNNTIGRPYVQEKVNPYVVLGAGVAGLVAFGGADALINRDFHHTHALIVGGLTAGLAAYNLSEVTKIFVGRLRPDFRDRFTRAGCSGRVSAPASLDCDAAPQDGFVITADQVRDGMKSFPSSHASTAFSMATYFSMVLGGEFMWGKRASWITAPLAAMAAGGMYAGAAFVAASRVSDNRHHLEDVAVGAALGSGFAAASYLLHFDLDGDARWRTFSLSTFGVQGKGGGVAVGSTF